MKNGTGVRKLENNIQNMILRGFSQESGKVIGDKGCYNSNKRIYQ